MSKITSVCSAHSWSVWSYCFFLAIVQRNNLCNILRAAERFSTHILYLDLSHWTHNDHHRYQLVNECGTNIIICNVLIPRLPKAVSPTRPIETSLISLMLRLSSVNMSIKNHKHRLPENIDSDIAWYSAHKVNEPTNSRCYGCLSVRYFFWIYSKKFFPVSF